VVALYAPSEMASLEKTTGSRSFLDGALQKYIGGLPQQYPDRYRMLSPVTYVGSDAPPTLSIKGRSDRIVPDSQIQLIDQKLSENGVYHEIYLVPFQDHGFDSNWNGIGTQIARDKIAAFLEKYAK